MADNKNSQVFSNSQLFFMVALRIVIGWHFLYEGILKLMNQGGSVLAVESE